MSQPFAFPPPPPPPPKRDQNPDSFSPHFSRPNNRTDRGRGEYGAGYGQHGRGQRGGDRGVGRGSSHGLSSRADTRPMQAPHNKTRAGLQNGYNAAKSHTSVSSSSTIPSQKRDYTSAFPHNSQSLRDSRPKAAPAVPSFDIDVNSLLLKKPEQKVPAKSAAPKKNNMLGLTPSMQKLESDSSDGEDDEIKLAGAVVGDVISFEHKGQTLSLKTPAEIAAWIAERRKKFPTQAIAEVAKREVAEKRRLWEEQKRERQDAGRLRAEERNRERQEREKKRLRERLIDVQVQKSKAALASTKVDSTEQARLKAERLRRKAEKAALQLRQAEEALKKAKAQQEQHEPRGSTQGKTEGTDLDDANEHTNGTVSVDGIGPSAQLAYPAAAGSDEADSISSLSDSSDAEETSSSGTSGSDDDSGFDSDSAPEESSSKRTGPERVSPPGSAAKPDEVRVCRNLTKTGRCKYGKKCRYSHDVPSKKATMVKAKQLVTSTRRKGLFQLMVEKEQEEQRRRALRVIIALGQQGVLDDKSQASGEHERPV